VFLTSEGLSIPNKLIEYGENVEAEKCFLLKYLAWRNQTQIFFFFYGPKLAHFYDKIILVLSKFERHEKSGIQTLKSKYPRKILP
jgi:hypothetical protein